MASPRLLLLSSLLLIGGCLQPVREKTDRGVRDLAARPFDEAPAEAAHATLPAEDKAVVVPSADSDKPPQTDIQTTALMQVEREPAKAGVRPKLELSIPPELPGSEAPLIKSFDKMTPEEKQRATQKLYPELPPLPVVPVAQAGPQGRSYTLADLQKLATENSPQLRQVASDLQAARGALVQAKTYQNPTLYYAAQPTNNNSTTGAQGAGIEQKVVMWGKMKMAVAAAQKDLDNAELALRRARSDLATSVRNAYYALLVAQESVRVTRALAHFTDEIYRLQTAYLAGGFAAAYEPAALRAQAYTTRLANKQAISTYIYSWKQLVATLGLPQLPLSEVGGHIDRLIPYYDYDKVLEYARTHHTDVLTAQNGVDKARYNLKLAQITPMPDFNVSAYVFKEATLAPFSIFHTVQIGFPLPIWDQNKGNIISAQGALIRASEETHRVEVALTNNLAAAYVNYKNNLDALEYYRRYILPDQVRAYRGVFERRQIDINAQFGDLVTAQQTLATNVNSYLGILGQLWQSVVGVADYLQTDDLFQLAKPRELPELPALDNVPRWTCPHHRATEGGASGANNGPPPKCACVALVPVPAAPTPAPVTPALATPAPVKNQLLEPPPAIRKLSSVSEPVGEPSIRHAD